MLSAHVEFKSEKIFKKKYDKQGIINKDIEEIRNILDGISGLSLVANCNLTPMGGDRWIIVYSLDHGLTHYADVIVKAKNNDYLEVRVDHYGDTHAMDLKSKIKKELGHLKKKQYFF